MKPSWTGERLETFIFNETTIEHLHRYAVALDFVDNKKVLDIACGEGYGTNLLSRNAQLVTGIDIDSAAIERAKAKYKAGNIVFKKGSATNIPCEDNYFDIIVSFETLEHVDEQDKFLLEIKRVLKPFGLLLISTPDKSNYSDISETKNPFHKKELYEREFKDLLKKYFEFTSFYRQSSFLGSFILRENSTEIEHIYTGNYTSISREKSPSVLYHIAFASDIEIPNLIPSLFQNQELLNQLLEEQRLALKRTITYMTGDIILSPLKFVRSLFKK